MYSLTFSIPAVSAHGQANSLLSPEPLVKQEVLSINTLPIFPRLTRLKKNRYIECTHNDFVLLYLEN